jgi:hypothetical protein
MADATAIWGLPVVAAVGLKASDGAPEFRSADSPLSDAAEPPGTAGLVLVRGFIAASVSRKIVHYESGDRSVRRNIATYAGKCRRELCKNCVR